MHNPAVATLSYSFDHTKPRDAVWKPHVVESHGRGQQLDCYGFTYEICLIHFANCQQKAFVPLSEFCFPISFSDSLIFVKPESAASCPLKHPEEDELEMLEVTASQAAAKKNRIDAAAVAVFITAEWHFLQ